MNRILAFCLALFSITATCAYGATGYLTIRSEPTGAMVSIDGVRIGQTPVETYKVAAGQHNVLVEFSGYETKRINIEIPPNEIVEHRVILLKDDSYRFPDEDTQRLSQQKGKLSIITEPSGATVRLDGRLIEERTTPFMIELAAGEHEIELTRPVSDLLRKEFSVRKTVRVEPEQASVLDVDFGEYLKTGCLQLDSNERGRIQIRSQQGNLSANSMAPGRFDLFAGKYSLHWNDNFRDNSFVFDVQSDSVTHAFVAFYKRELARKTMDDVPGFMTLDDYLGKNYKPEYDRTQKTSGLRWKYRHGRTNFLMAAFWTSPLLLAAIFEDTPGPGANIAFGAAWAGLMTWSAIANIETDHEYVLDEEAASRNRDRKAEVNAEYEAKRKAWTATLERLNAEIDEKNRSIRQANSELPPAGVKLTTASGAEYEQI
ncbi:MAG: PEGA domain-containing protein [Candidatus Krumholzibacteriia bacterium]